MATARIGYKGTKGDFMSLKSGDAFLEAICEAAPPYRRQPHMGAEQQSWKNSYTPIYNILYNAQVPDDISVVAEYQLKVGSFRIDFFLTGYDRAGNPVAVIIEMKQWSQDNISLTEEDGDIITVSARPSYPSPHPSYQAWTYAMMLSNYNAYVQDTPVQLSPCSYLFQYSPLAGQQDILTQPQFAQYLDNAPMFDQDKKRELEALLKEKLHTGDNFIVYEGIERSEIRPSAALQDKVADMLEGNPAFVLVDSQKIIYDKAVSLIKQGLQDCKRRVYIIHGGPGTGKSVVAVNLMANLLINGVSVKETVRATVAGSKIKQKKLKGHPNALHLYCPYLTKTSAPKEVYKTLLARHSNTGNRWTKTELNGLFIGAGSFRKEPEHPVYAGLLIDEAHRIKARDRFSNYTNYLQNIMLSAYTTVFFVDDHQQVTTEDFGSSASIKELANRNGIEVFEDTLTTEFRCLGGNDYLSWVDHLLYDPQGSDIPTLQDCSYDIQIFDDPQLMHDAIVAKNDLTSNDKSVTSRVLAGYCWKWVTKKKQYSNIYDIEIPRPDGSKYRRKWNFDTTSPFALRQEGVDEVGCIHTSQGLEFEYVGVIIGPDMRFEDGKIVTDASKRDSRDTSTRKNSMNATPATTDQIIRNTYRVLMTRGQKGCYIFCTDPALAAYIKSKL